MCLLVVASRVDAEWPLVVAANRDERLERPALACTVLQPAGPRILGGRDEVAGGTWLAVNEQGVVAGLTNRPSPGGRDASKRTRGELPLAAAAWPSAERAASDLMARFRPADYNAAWLLIGDRDGLFFVDMTGPDRALVEELAPGIHVLENRPLGEPSPKASRIRALLDGAESLRGDGLVERLRSVLSDHTVPAGEGRGVPADGASGAVGRPAGEGPAGERPADERSVDDEGTGVPRRPVEVEAACVHTEGYGTRSATMVVVPARRSRRPTVEVADGHPCTAPWVDRSDWWSGAMSSGPAS